MTSIEILPLTVLSKILSYVSPNDAASLAFTSKALFRSVTEDTALWKRLCGEVWLCSQLSLGTCTWFDQWKEFCRNYGTYARCFADIKKAWNSIESFLQVNVPEIYDKLMDSKGVSEAELSDLEHRLSFPLPTDLKLSLRIHGSKSVELGRTDFYSMHAKFRLLGVPDLQVVAVAPTANPHQLQRYLPVAENYLHSTPWGETIVLSLTEEQEIQCGQVSNVYLLPGANEKSVFISAKQSFTFSQWLTMEGSRTHLFVPSKGTLLRFQLNPECVAVTQYFKVSAATAFDPSLGIWQGQYMTGFGYHIIIEMSNEAPTEEMCQLTRRHWVIKQSDGEEHIVDGEGVIGKFPKFCPGNRFEYASYTNCNGSETMSGYFTMQYLSKPGRFRIEVPEFRMTVSPNLFNIPLGTVERNPEQSL